ncbi:MAG TPA: hypothetical protein VFK36_14425 [Gemmatimonadales bacterium]|nr:hypothetical protein [Gemmatimonadales bacterium]
MINMVFSFLAGLYKSEDGSGLDLMLTEMNPLKHLELLRPSKFLPRGRRYLYASWATAIVQVILMILLIISGTF